MRVVIAGSGSPAGDATASALRERGHEVLRVDKDDLATWQRRRALAA